MTRRQSFNGVCFCIRPVMHTIVPLDRNRWRRHAGLRKKRRERNKELLAVSTDLTAQFTVGVQRFIDLFSLNKNV